MYKKKNNNNNKKNLGLVFLFYIFIYLYKKYNIYRNKRNDPSAGSPTDALLRLLFPLDHTVRVHSYRTQSLKMNRVPVLYTHRIVHR